MADRRTVEMRRQMLMDTLRDRPLSTAREISQRIVDETGGSPALVTGAYYYPSWTVLSDLYVLERRGEVQRVQVEGRRSIGWLPVEARETAPASPKEGTDG
jgi:hypothetical protein